MSSFYGLDGQPIGPLEADELLADGPARQIAETRIVTERGTIEVSTIFLVLNHDFLGSGPPVLWETMTFGGPTDMEQTRYRSREDAEYGHFETVALVHVALDAEGVEVLAMETFTPSPTTPALPPA